jgi:hypothetical protein
MNTPKTGMRTILAAAAAGALVLGSAAGVSAAPKVPSPANGPMVTTVPVKFQSVSIKGHKPIDLNGLPADAAIKLRAKSLGKKDPAASVEVVLGVYDKKVGGTLVAGSESDTVTLDLRATKSKNVSFFAGDAVIAEVWEAGQLAVLAGAVEANGKAFICIAEADLVPSTTEKNSMLVNKRLGKAKGKAVRDCVRVIDSSVPTPPATS